MAVRTNIGKVGAAIEAGRRAAESIDHGPISLLSTVHANQNRFIADWHNVPTDNSIFIWNAHVWGSTTQKVAK